MAAGSSPAPTGSWDPIRSTTTTPFSATSITDLIRLLVNQSWNADQTWQLFTIGAGPGEPQQLVED